MGLKEELLAVDPERYAGIRKDVEQEWAQSSAETRNTDFMERLVTYGFLATEVRLAKESAASYDGGTLFGGQEGGAERESLVGALSLILYAETET